MIFLSETRLLLTDCWCSCVLPRTFFLFLLLVDRATVPTQTLSNWTNSPRPYCSLEELLDTPLLNNSSSSSSLSFASRAKHYPLLLPSSLRPLFILLLTKDRCQKNGAHIFYFSRSVSVCLGFFSPQSNLKLVLKRS